MFEHFTNSICGPLVTQVTPDDGWDLVGFVDVVFDSKSFFNENFNI